MNSIINYIKLKLKIYFRGIQLVFLKESNFFKNGNICCPIDLILISENFSENKIREEKIKDKVLFFVNNGYFMEEIVINQDGILVDGYTTYMLAKDWDFKYVKVSLKT